MTFTPFQAIYPNVGRIDDLDKFFSAAKIMYPEYWRDNKFLIDDDKAVYVYDITSRFRTLTGIVGCLNVQDYLEGRMVRHEHTIWQNEERMLNLYRDRNALIKPVLLTYAEDPEIEKLISEAKAGSPFLKLTIDDGVEHAMYKINDPESLKILQARFRENVRKTYIADGHHRCHTSVTLYKENQGLDNGKDYSRIMCMLMTFENVIIHDFNRVVEILHEFSPTAFISRLSQVCDILPLKSPQKPERKFDMTMYILKEWYLLRWKPGVLDRFNDHEVILDGTILNKVVLDEILGISDPRNDVRLKYVQGLAGIEGVTRKAERSIFRIAFCLYPVKVEEIVKLTDDDRTLPPKSTWFEPRVKNGMLNMSFDKDK